MLQFISSACYVHKDILEEFMTDYIYIIRVKIFIFYFFLKKSSQRKKKIKWTTITIVFWEESSNPSSDVLCRPTHVPAWYFFPQYAYSLYHTHSNTTSIRCRCFILVCCSAPHWFPQRELVVGKKQEGGKCDSHISANCFP